MIPNRFQIMQTMPTWISKNPVALYIVALAIVSIMYSAYVMPWYYMLFGVVSVVAFFIYGSTLSKNLAMEKMRKEKDFEKKIFLIALVPRVVFMSLIYWIFMTNYGNEFGFENQDAMYYHELGEFVADMIDKGS